MEELLTPLNPAQIQCVERITNKDTLIYLELQQENQWITVGYTTLDGIYAAIVILKDNVCNLEFQEKVSDLQDVFDNKYEPVFRSIHKIELT